MSFARDAAAHTYRPPYVIPAPEPERTPGRLVFGLAFAQFGIMLSLLTPMMVTLALRVAQIVPAAERGAALGQVLSLGAILAMLANPVFGALSDRTTGRLGRRRPWLIGGAAVALLGLVIVGLADSVQVLMLGWAVAQLGGNAALTAVTACVPDLVPEGQRALISGTVGMMTSIAIVTGTFVADLFEANLIMAFAVPGVTGLTGAVWLAVVMKDRPAQPGAFGRYGVREFLRSFWVNPRKHADFARNFVGRFLVFTGISCVTSYQVYFLMDRLGYAPGEVAEKLSLAMVAMVAGVVVGSLLGGAVSDSTGRRKPFVLFSSLVIAVGLALVATAHSYLAFAAALMVFGFGEGLYLSVDVALAAEVLPNPEESAKDMGVLNIGNALPQSLVPIIAPTLLAIGGGGNYGALFLFGGIACVLGAVATQLIRSVK